MSLLSAEHISRTYPAGDAAVAAVDDVSLEVERGEFVAIVGPSGCGKSTLLHLCGAMERPSAGRIRSTGRVWTRWPTTADARAARAARIRLPVLQPAADADPVENIALPLLLAGRPRTRRWRGRRRGPPTWASRIGSAIARRSCPAARCSGRPLRGPSCTTRPWSIADEPTGNLDSANGARVLDVLVRLNRERGVTMLLATHAAEVAAAADRIVHMRDGRVDRVDVRRRQREAAECRSLGGSSSVACARSASASALTVAGIALGIAVVLAIRLANDSALGGFLAALDTVAGGRRSK